ncbi:TPA: hypothetical protein DEX28_01860 [Patescibacteria group bacterium]|nr:hypothetical protein [Patescibacteria group bacterium]
MVISAGLLMFHRDQKRLKVFLIHPGGPFWGKKELGIWAIPKGQVNDGEDVFEAAKREFFEETGIQIPETEFIDLGFIKLKSGKKIHAWAFEGTGSEQFIKSIGFEIEWPPKSGKLKKFPENDKGGYFPLEELKDKIHPLYLAFIDRLLEKIRL